MKNSLADLNDHLFAQLDRLTKPGMTAEQVAQEVSRAGAMVDIAEAVLHGADLQLKATVVIANHGDRFKPYIAMLEAPKE